MLNTQSTLGTRDWVRLITNGGGSASRKRKHAHRFGFITWDTWDSEDSTIPIVVTYSNVDNTTTGPLPPNHTEKGYAENRQWEIFVGGRTGSTVVSDIVGVRVDFTFDGKAENVVDGTDWVGRFGWDAVAIIVFILVVVIVAILLA